MVGSILVVVSAPRIDDPVRSPIVTGLPVVGSVATTVLGSNVGSTLVVVGAAVDAVVVEGVNTSAPAAIDPVVPAPIRAPNTPLVRAWLGSKTNPRPNATLVAFCSAMS